MRFFSEYTYSPRRCRLLLRIRKRQDTSPSPKRRLKKFDEITHMFVDFFRSKFGFRQDLSAPEKKLVSHKKKTKHTGQVHPIVRGCWSKQVSPFA